MIVAPTNQPSQIIRNTAALGASRLADKASSVCLSFLVARQLGPAALGVYSAAIVFFGLASLLAGAGCSTFLVREISKDRSRTNQYFAHLALMAIVVSSGVMLTSLLVVPHLGYSTELAGAMYAITAACIPGCLKPIQEAVFVAHQRTEFIAYCSLAAAAINLSVTIYLLWHGYSIVSLVLAFAVLQYFVGICYCFFLHKYISRVRLVLDFHFVFRLVKEIRAFAGSSILAALFARPEILILSLFKNDAQIGFYSAALRIVDLWQLLPETLMTNVLPILARSRQANHSHQSRIILEKTIQYLLAIAFPLTVGIFLTARPIVGLIYGPGFEPAVLMLQILAWYIPLIFMLEVLWRLLVARDEQHLMLRAQVVTTIVRLAGGYVLIAWLGGVGAAISTTLILLVHDLLLWIYIRRDGTQLRIVRLAARLSVAALGMGIVTTALVGRLHLFVLIPLAAVCYLAMVVLLRALSWDDFELFRKPDPVRGLS